MKRLSIITTLMLLFSISIYSQEGYKVGDKASNFSLKDVTGKKVSLADFPNAKGYIVIFTCNHCPYAIAYEDRIIDLNNKYAPLGYPVIAINPNDPTVQPADSYEAMQVRAKEKNFEFPYLFDEGQKVFPQFGATRTPHAFILEKTKEGNIVRYIGAIDDNYEDPSAVKTNYIVNTVDALLQGNANTINPTFTKAIGCTIKVKK